MRSFVGQMLPTLQLQFQFPGLPNQLADRELFPKLLSPYSIDNWIFQMDLQEITQIKRMSIFH